MKLNLKNKAILISFSLCFVLASLAIAASFYFHEIDNKKSKAYRIAEAYAVELKRDFGYAASSTRSMEDLVIEKSGKVSESEFVNASKLLKKDYISLTELVPNGVVTKSYPHVPSQKLNNNLMKVPEASRVLKFVRQKKRPVIYGPMRLNNLKRCVVIMEPVTLKNGKFWGYVMVTVTLPDVYRHTLKNLTAMGYDYCIDTNKSPLTNKRTQVESSLPDKRKILKNAVGYTFTYGSCWWSLKIAPKKMVGGLKRPCFCCFWPC